MFIFTHTSFVLANAQVVDYPIVYCNDGFSKLVGYSRAEIMQKPCSEGAKGHLIRKRKKNGNSAGDMAHLSRGVIKCLRMTRMVNEIEGLGGIGDFFPGPRNLLAFMHGDHGEPGSLQKIQDALEQGRTEQAEIGLCKKNKTPIWLLIHLAPIKNDKDTVVLYLCQFKDITPLKQPLDDENNKGKRN
ncbi:hypothetical protein WR25_01782 [Diploscapter pachys]|uniref:PAC domain-containing protein n=1 Tax=Diploscapter pachys TaxID=2018661 RepID=A0A2A2JIF4_9BILA|nr:hypothetical protein WR25_01782 [Diploscapter pachys]